ncbi:MAG: tripartite tricarboxylate transporter substrate binding protein [Burkholderiales bacterium]|nr:tripartite tricarboxylate transporter substrate binding protein [Burkholderiales bacterium]
MQVSIVRYALIAATLSCGVAGAQSYPARPVRLIVPFAPGGSTDIIARVVGQRVGERFGQQIVIDNRPGAASNLGTALAARAAADGYTILMGTPGFTINPSLYHDAGFHPLRDFGAITLLASVPLMIVVHPALAANSVQELIALAKAKPGAINYASAGSSTHLTAELFLQRAGITLTHIPYKGSAPATNDLVAGHVQAAVDNILSALPHVKTGKLRALAVTTAARASAAPGVPTLSEAGFAGFEASSWFGMLAPAGTDRAIIARIDAQAQQALRDSDVRTRLANVGADIVALGPQAFAKFIADEHQRWARLIRERSIKAS